jgi:hypothetical protein
MLPRQTAMGSIRLSQKYLPQKDFAPDAWRVKCHHKEPDHWDIKRGWLVVVELEGCRVRAVEPMGSGEGASA